MSSLLTLSTLQSAQVPADLVDKLERLALVDFRTKQGLDCLQKAIRFADQLHVVDTSGVEPMDSVLEDRYVTDSFVHLVDCGHCDYSYDLLSSILTESPAYLNIIRSLHLRDDVVMEGDCTEELLQLSKSTFEEYFVAPPGEILLLETLGTTDCISAKCVNTS